MLCYTVHLSLESGTRAVQVEWHPLVIEEAKEGCDGHLGIVSWDWYLMVPLPQFCLGEDHFLGRGYMSSYDSGSGSRMVTRSLQT